MLQGLASGSAGSVTTPVVVDVRLRPSGTVTGIVRDSAGNPAPSTVVAISSDGAPRGYDRYPTTDATGRFTLVHVPVGGITVQSCIPAAGENVNCGIASGVLAADSQTVTIDLAVPGTGTVSGTVFGADGATPMSSAPIFITSGSDGPLGAYGVSSVTDVNGHYVQSSVPAGLVMVGAFDPQNFAVIGSHAATLTAGGSLTVNVVRGTAAPQCGYSATGPDGFVYSAGCAGELQNGGTADGTLRDAYRFDAYTLRVNGHSPSGNKPAALEMAGRQIVYGPYTLGGVDATRRLFIPSTGGFARYLDTVANTSPVPVTVNVQIDGTLGGVVHVVVDPSTRGNTYAVTLADPTTTSQSEEGPATRPALGHVFGGPNALVPVSAIHIQRLLGPTYYRWTVTIPPGESATLMHFALQRNPTDTAGADAQAQALVNLTDPNVLAGMTAEEKARVVNFKLQ
jgi:hypothetical protein